jgi:hypothetical protein
MNITIEEKKQKALELMNTLNLYKPYIKGFEQHNDVCYYEGFGGFWAYQEKDKDIREGTQLPRICGNPRILGIWRMLRLSLYPRLQRRLGFRSRASRQHVLCPCLRLEQRL